MFCINRNSEEFKELVELVGYRDAVAYYLAKGYVDTEDTGFTPTTETSTGIKPGVQELFESNPELANIGTPELYSQYLDTGKKDIEGFKKFVGDTDLVQEVTKNIKNNLPKEIADAVEVLNVVPQEILGRSDLYYSMKDVLEKKGITDPFLINWLGINLSANFYRGNFIKSITSERQIEEFATYSYNNLLKAELNILKNKDIKNSFDNWVKALEKYPVVFRDLMLKHATKHLRNPKRRAKFVLQLSAVALQQTYGIAVNKPHELNRIGKIYDSEVLKTVSDAVGHEPSASGKGYWVHIPRTSSLGFMGHDSYEKFKLFTEKTIKSIESKIQSEKDKIESGKYEDLIDQLEKLQSEEVVFNTQEPNLDRKTANSYGFDNFTFVRVESTYSRWDKNEIPSLILRNQPHIKELGEDYEGYYIHGYNTEYGKPDTKIVKITKEQAEEIWQKEKDKYPESALEVDDRNKIYQLKNEIRRLNPTEIEKSIKVYEEQLNNYKKQLETIKPEEWSSKANAFTANVQMLRKLSPATWCTASGMANHYVENYDNYLLIVDGITVVGIEAYPPSNTNLTKAIFTRNEDGSIYEKSFQSDEELFRYAEETDETFTILTRKSDKTKVREVTSIVNKGVASIDHLDDTIAFFKKHNLDTNNNSLQRAINAKNNGKRDIDLFDKRDEPDGPYNPYGEGYDADGYPNDPPENYWEGYEDLGLGADEFEMTYQNLLTRARSITAEEILTGNINHLYRYFNEFPQAVKDNQTVAKFAVAYDAHNIAHINENLPFYNELAIEAVTKLPYVFDYLSPTGKEIPGLRDLFNAYQEASDALPFSKTNTNLIQGYYDAKKDKVVVIASNTPINEASKVAIHEVAHRGMLRMAKDLGGEKELFQVLKNAENQLMEKLPELLKRTGHTSLDSLMLDYGFNKNSEEGKFKLLQELAARWAETLVNKPKPTWWKQLIENIKQWITKFTGKVLNETEVNELVGGFVRYGTQNKDSSKKSRLLVGEERKAVAKMLGLTKSKVGKKKRSEVIKFVDYYNKRNTEGRKFYVPFKLVQKGYGTDEFTWEIYDYGTGQMSMDFNRPVVDQKEETSPVVEELMTPQQIAKQREFEEVVIRAELDKIKGIDEFGDSFGPETTNLENGYINPIKNPVLYNAYVKKYNLENDDDITGYEFLDSENNDMPFFYKFLKDYGYRGLNLSDYDLGTLNFSQYDQDVQKNNNFNRGIDPIAGFPVPPNC